MKVNWKLTIAALALSLVAGIAVAQGPGPHGHEGLFSGHMMEFFTDYLSLTDAQQAQIKAIADKERPAGAPLMEQMMQSHQAMTALVTSGNFDEAKARAIATQQSQTMVEMEAQKAKTEAEMYQVLTTDQKTKLNTWIAKKQAEFQKHMQDKAGPPPPPQS
ncbi:MAG: Spy/CpxP family protein refolding chaperone [Acidobacteriales bacterium]|nr:Spy/CpxP family protein refolding chaperone [Terriglobales bacterium]